MWRESSALKLTDVRLITVMWEKSPGHPCSISQNATRMGGHPMHTCSHTYSSHFLAEFHTDSHCFLFFIIFCPVLHLSLLSWNLKDTKYLVISHYWMIIFFKWIELNNDTVVFSRVAYIWIELYFHNLSILDMTCTYIFAVFPSTHNPDFLDWLKQLSGKERDFCKELVSVVNKLNMPECALIFKVCFQV